jgi:hypothetical protein
LFSPWILPPISFFGALYLAEATLPSVVTARHFDDMGQEKIEMDGRLGRRTPCRCCRRSLHEGESVSAEKITEAAREVRYLKQVSQKCNDRHFSTYQCAEQEFFMFVQELLPRIQSGNCNAEMFTNCRYGRVPLEIGGQSGEFET